MKEVQKSDSYLIDRIVIAKNMDEAYMLEVEGCCPLCGKNLLVAKGKGKTKLYQIAHIYPNSPKPDQIKELAGLERLGDTCENSKNKIALCKDCHSSYDDHVTKDEYLRLVKIKKSLLRVANAKATISCQMLDDEIVLIINALATLDESTIKKMKLNYKGIKITNKIEDTYMILRNKIKSYISNYYFFIKETFQNLEQSDQINFSIIASEIKTSFLECEKETVDKSEIFLLLVKWMQSKVNGSSYEACEVVVSYFVQNCEVFHEITK